MGMCVGQAEVAHITSTSIALLPSNDKGDQEMPSLCAQKEGENMVFRECLCLQQKKNSEKVESSERKKDQGT